MKRRFFQKLLVFTLIASLIIPWSGLALAASLTPQKEREIGQRFHMRIAAAGVLLDDPIALNYYRGITGRIMKGAGLKPDQYNFYIVKSDSINAFAVPGGYVYMHTGTINSLENEGQLASILGHEVAHITSRHFARRVESSSAMSLGYLAALLAGALVASRGGGNSAAIGQALMLGGSGATISSMLANSRQDEEEADGKGRKYLTAAGYNARDMYGAFRIMANKTYQVSPDTGSYLTTHPALTSRLATTFKDYENSSPTPADAKYQAFADRVLALSGDDKIVQSVMGKRLRANPNDHSAKHALGLLAARLQNLKNADRFMKEALALSPNNKEYLADLGELALRRRNPEEAKNYFQKAEQNNRQVVLGQARASELLGEKTKAAGLYERAINMDKEAYPEALELAGRFFGQNGQRGKGHYYMGRYFASKGNMDKAIFHYEAVSEQADAGNLRNVAAREAKRLTDLKKEEKK